VDWSRAQDWTFEPLDNEAFPAVDLVRQAGRLGGTAPAALNAANEECVDAFHEGRIGFTRIIDIVAAVVEEHVRLATDSELPGPPILADSQPPQAAEPGSATKADVGSMATLQTAGFVSSSDLTVEAIGRTDGWARRRAAEMCQ
jgi:1-deoxy-D-xylulose-5-phosphate reductoisomerase